MATQPAADGAGTATARGGRVATGVAALGALAFLPFGGWAMIAPRSFFEQLARFEPYNQHFIQDIGAFQLGLGAVLLLAALRPRAEALALTLLGTGFGAAAHALSHVVGRDLGGNPSSDIPLFTLIAVLLVGAGVARARSSPS